MPLEGDSPSGAFVPPTWALTQVKPDDGWRGETPKEDMTAAKTLAVHLEVGHPNPDETTKSRHRKRALRALARFNKAAEDLQEEQGLDEMFLVRRRWDTNKMKFQVTTSTFASPAVTPELVPSIESFFVKDWRVEETLESNLKRYTKFCNKMLVCRLLDHVRGFGGGHHAIGNGASRALISLLRPKEDREAPRFSDAEKSEAEEGKETDTGDSPTRAHPDKGPGADLQQPSHNPSDTSTGSTMHQGVLPIPSTEQTVGNPAESVPPPKKRTRSGKA